MDKTVWCEYGIGANGFQHKIKLVEKDSINEFDLQIIYPYSNDVELNHLPFYVFGEFDSLNGISGIKLQKTQISRLIDALSVSIDNRLNSKSKSGRIIQDEIDYANELKNTKRHIQKAVYGVFK